MGMKHGVWVAAQVRGKHEFLVSEALQQKGYETFVPSYVSVRRWSDRKKVVELPLISGYVLVRTLLEEPQGLVVSTPGVTRMVAFGGQIQPICEDEVNRMKTVAGSALKLEPWRYVGPGSSVVISQGSLAGLKGTVLQHKGTTLLVISIEMLQRSVAVEIDRSWVTAQQ